MEMRDIDASILEVGINMSPPRVKGKGVTRKCSGRTRTRRPIKDRKMRRATQIGMKWGQEGMDKQNMDVNEVGEETTTERMKMIPTTTQMEGEEWGEGRNGGERGEERDGGGGVDNVKPSDRVNNKGARETDKEPMEGREGAETREKNAVVFEGGNNLVRQMAMVRQREEMEREQNGQR